MKVTYALFEITRGRLGPVLATAVLVLLCPHISARQHVSCEPHWIPTFGGLPGTNVGWHVAYGGVEAFLTFDDGTGPALYAGGQFSSVNGQYIERVARWDGQSWSPLGQGLKGCLGNFCPPVVSVLAIYDDGAGQGPELYAGGNFTHSGDDVVFGLARWDGDLQQWKPVGGGTGFFGSGPGWIKSMAVFDDGSGDGPALFVGGRFTLAGGAEVNHIAKWNGQSWSDVGGGVGGTPNAWVQALQVFDDGNGPALFAGGYFYTAGGVLVNHIAKWDGTAWSPLGGGVTGSDFVFWAPSPSVLALEVFDDGAGDALYLGGRFKFADGVSANRIAKWDGTSFSPLGSGMSGASSAVLALTVFDDGSGEGSALYAGGEFLTAGGDDASRVARWDGENWSALGAGTDGGPGFVFALGSFDENMDGQPALFAGGSFRFAGEVAARNIARWDSEEWSPPVGSAGLDDAVRAVLAVDHDPVGEGPALYVGGEFSYAGDSVFATRIARFDGLEWSDLQGGVNHEVDALAAFDDGDGPALYAAGFFTQAGGVPVNYIAKWDGQSWSPLGSGLGDRVHALAVFDDGSGPALYAGGQFLTAGGQPALRIAKWNGQEWSPVGTGFPGMGMQAVYALTVFDDGSGPALYAGGRLLGVNHVAKWDGVSWTALGSGMSDVNPPIGGITGVHAFEVFDDGTGPALYASGRFTHAGGALANNVARWDGVTWSPLDNGIPQAVPGIFALTVYDDGTGGGPALFAAGHPFTMQGQVDNVARWNGATWLPVGLLGDLVWSSGAVHDMTVFDDGSGSGPMLIAGGVIQWSVSHDSYLAAWGGCAGAGIPGDLTGDGSVGVADLLILLSAWGKCDDPAPGRCPADLDGDGFVGVSDLLILLSNWG